LKDVLIINSYAGSLVLGCKAAGFPIRGSYEDAAFGIEAQKLNFPDLNYVDRLPWPEDDLSETVVIAHPPCAPFSIQNSGRKGVDGDGFQCHRNVMEYAFDCGCEALAIESVPGVLRAADEYAAYGKIHNYQHFFLRVNSIGFGVPQWRPRVWIIFIRTDKFDVEYRPVYRPLKTVIQPEGEVIMSREAISAIKKMKAVGMDHELMRALFEGQHGDGTLLQLGKQYLGIEDVGENFEEIRKAWGLSGILASKVPRVLHQESWAPTVLKDSAWFIHGRPLFLEEFNLIMGFPADYIWPAKWEPRTYLSKGVCPPVATWILQQIAANLSPDKPEFELGTTYRRCLPGEVLDLCPKKAEVEDALAGRPDTPPKMPKARGPKKERQGKTTPVRIRATASELAANFLKSLGE
jgi:site-specific DNA-cytosine methylase